MREDVGTEQGTESSATLRSRPVCGRLGQHCGKMSRSSDRVAGGKRRTRCAGKSWRTFTALFVALASAALTSGCVGSPVRFEPSHAAPPIGDLPGWRQIFVDDFNSTSLSDRWGVYDGQPGGDPLSHWDPSRVATRDSQLLLEGYPEDGRWITGGVSNHTVAQTYGRWDVRFRIDPSDEIRFAILLWAQGGDWPPEIDFLEDGGGGRQTASGFVHYKTAGGRSQEQRTVAADFTQWQIVGVEWLPGKIAFTLNGRVWATVTGASVPSQPMWLAIQEQFAGCERRAAASSLAGCPIAGTPERTALQVDWVTIYAPG
jgi:hypothetical protein